MTEDIERPAAPCWRRVVGRAAAISGCVAICLVLLFGVVDAVLTGESIHRGVFIGDTYVGGLTKREAASLIRERLAPALGRPAELQYGSRSWKLDPSRLGAEIDLASTARRAWLVGRNGNPASDALGRFGAWIRPVRVDVVGSANRDEVDALIARMSREVSRPARNAMLRISGARLVRVAAKDGVVVRSAKARRAILAALVASRDRRRLLPVSVVRPRIPDDVADYAAARARTILARPLHLRYRGHLWKVSRAQLGGWIVFRRRLQGTAAGGPPVALEAVLSRKAVTRTIRRVTRLITRQPVDAQFEVVGERIRIVPGRPGAGIDTARAFPAIQAVLGTRRYRLVRVFSTPLSPRLTTQWARATGISVLLGTYTTKYDPDAEARVSNIHLLLRHLNNTFVAPGKVFSFNKTIGPRTAEKGYQEAPAIVGGELVPSIGGGVCQVATTLFNGVFFSGLEVVERHNHSFYISHYPDGRDATVSWDGPDLRFRNDTSRWVLIKAWWGDGWVTISLYGTKTGNEVTYETSEFRDFVDPPLQKVKDLEMPAGATEVEDSGIAGRGITVTRTVTRAGVVVHKNVFESRYEPKAGKVRVGAKPLPTPSKETSPPVKL